MNNSKNLYSNLDNKQNEISIQTYKTLIDKLTDAFALCEVICDDKDNPIDYRFKLLNPAFEKQSGIDIKMALGRTIKQIYPDIEQSWIDRYGKVALTRKSITFTDYNHNTDKYYSVKAYSPIKNHFAIVFTDITEKKLLEEEIVQSTERYRNFVKNAGEGIYRIDFTKNINVDLPDNRLIQQISKYSIISEVNKSLAEMYGLTPEDMVGHPVIDFAPRYGERVLQVVRSKKHKVYDVNTVDIDKNGNEIYLVENFSAVIKNGILIRIWGTQRDITEKKKLLEKVIDSEKQLRMITENTSDNIALTTFDMKAKYIYASPSTEYLTGWKVDDLIGKSFFDFIHPEDKKALFPLLKKYVSKKVKNILGGEEKPITESIEFRFKNKAGDWLYMQSTINIAGKQLLSVSRDVSEYKNMLDSLNKSETRLKEAQRIAHIGSWELDLLNNVLYWSDEVFNIFGLKPQQFEATYEAFLDNIHPDDREFVNKSYTESVSNKTPYDIVHRLKLKDGTIKFVNERCETYYDKSGNAVKSIGTVQDITKRIQTENKTLRFSKIIEDSLNEIYIFNAETLKFEYVNHGARQNIGFSRKKLLNMTPLDIKPEFTSELFETLISPLRTGNKQIITFNTVHKRKDNSLYDVEVHLQLIKYGQEELFVAIILDITDRKKVEIELEKYREDLEILVDKRTKELEYANRRLDDSLKVFVGREQRILDLEREIKELKSSFKNRQK